MIYYFIPFLFLAILTSLESSKTYRFLIKNKYFYSLITLIFIIFIGLRYEVGCDWKKYQEMFEIYKYFSFTEIIQNNLFEQAKFQELGHIFLTKISRNIYFLNLIYSIIFTIPLLYFCSQLKRKYFALLISYPYYVIVIGMGPIRQAASISILMLSLILVSNKKYYGHFFLSMISLLIHQSSILFNGLILSSFLTKIKKIKLAKKDILIILLITLTILFSINPIFHKTYFILTSYKKIDPTYGNLLVNPAKGSIFIWLINFLPSLIFLKNKKKFDLNNNLKSIFTTFSILEILLLPMVFFNSVIAYRLLLYFFPSSIYITSIIPELNILNIKKEYIVNSIISIAFLSLIIWLKFAYHASCWIPYKNVLFIF